MAEHVISMVVNDDVGVLSRVTSIFKRKMLNIKYLTIVRESDAHTARMTMLVTGNYQDADLSCKFLSKNEDVLSIELFSTEEVIQRDLVLVKAKMGYTTDKVLTEMSQNFKFRILRKTDDELVLEYIGSKLEVQMFIEEAKKLSPIKISQTGIML